MKKIIKQNIEPIIIFLIIIILLIINGVDYFNQTFNSGIFPIKEVNGYSFWYYILNYNIGQILIYISPLIIAFLGLYKFHEKLSTGFSQNVLMRKNYTKFIKKEFFSSYTKGALVFPVISIIVLSIGLMLFSEVITITDSALPILYIPKELIGNEILFVIESIFLLFMYGILVINIGLICTYFINKFYIVIIGTFVIFNGINFLGGNIAMIVANILGNNQLLKTATNINIYNGYFPNNMLESYITILVYLALSFLIVIVLYKNKKKLIRNYE